MDPGAFVAPAWGSATRKPGDRWAFGFFPPEPVHRGLLLDQETVLLLSEADSALGHLAGLAHLIRDPGLLLVPYITREALASSRIEGTEASLSDVPQAEAGAPAVGRREQVEEVEKCAAALRRGIELTDTLPIAQRLINEIREVLLSGVRGADRLPGEIRRSPVWVGSSTDSPFS